MRDIDLLQLALGLVPPWLVAAADFDAAHAVKLVNDAVDKVRRAESKGRPELKRSRYLWLRLTPGCCTRCYCL